ncbi:hypothetical protein [Synoicihabitans lomoniglobus]|uniref:Uncharacterized protein n=1 Tax=Synoicihabitans lomoniglobus TaxID=2909285 RepID=A0AAF0I7L8_9BACT|nr:hypothetical protein [Opitutaceae bacterium LMO-M01]WED66841.1 hypothetical protein PXH66_08260 [Opitutaceae bacterium LMO-M01]
MKLLLFLISTLPLCAVSYVGDFDFSPGRTDDEIRVTGSATLTTPGTYSADSIRITGDLIISTPGTYRIETTAGTFRVSGSITGPGAGTTLEIEADDNLTSFTNGVTISFYTPEPEPEPADAPLLNISTRADIAPGKNLQPGFVVGGDIPRRVLIRAIGPGLAQFNITTAMPNPRLRVFQSGEEIASNDDWNAADAATMAAVGAFAIDAGSADAVAVLTLAPGAYTAIVDSATAGQGGEIILEVYFVN